MISPLPVGNCHGCGATAGLFDVESTGEKLCRACVGRAVGTRPAHDLEAGMSWHSVGSRAQTRTRAHGIAHEVAVETCPDCRRRLGWI